jgi:hypothetical protein
MILGILQEKYEPGAGKILITVPLKKGVTLFGMVYKDTTAKQADPMDRKIGGNCLYHLATLSESGIWWYLEYVVLIVFL